MIPLEITVAVFVFLRAFGEGLQVPPTQSGFFVCNSWEDYKSNATMDVTSNPNCQRNDYLHLDTPDLLQYRNISVKTYKVTTRDGYILHLFRLVPLAKYRNANKGVVMLQHASLSSSAQWIIFPKSLGLVLHEKGYDVWLSNFRGSYYGREHATLDPDREPLYWNFTFHEMGVHDIPDQIDFILRKSKAAKLTLVGHSMGATAASVYAASLPQHANANVDLFIFFAGPTYMPHMPTFGYALVSDWEPLWKSSLEMKIYEWAPRRKNPNIVFNFCTRDAEMIRLCALATQMFSGVSWKAIDWVPVIFAQFPAGISTKSYIHYGQLIKANGTHFRQFDYGDPEENQRIYGTPTPPEYVLDNLKVPVYSLIGDRDLLVSVEGVTKFHKKLKSEATFKLEVLKNYTHMDFVTGLRMKIINKKVLRALKTIKQKLK